ncbi:MAG: substrate-binding domain-containing protein [Verrucomicrobiae bacterium]|nr:substrate-binding domain-containing protein [Verrucomicrobiae bacterium]
MDLVPKRHSLLAETTAILREAVRSGRWQGSLPGERKLCSQMQIGRDTLRAAIRQMEREGLIAPGQAGRRRQITSVHSATGVVDRSPAGQHGVIVFLTPHHRERLHETLLLEVDVLRERLAGSGYRLEVVTNSKVFTLSRPNKALEKLNSDFPADAWVLHQTTAPIQRWFADKGPPCLLHGQPQGVDLPAVDIDYTAVGRHAGGYLIRQGHRNVTLVRPHAPLRGLDMAEAGLQNAFSKHPGETLAPPTTMRETESGDARALAESIRRLMQSPRRPTALVLTRTRQVLTVLSFLATQRMRVPEDLSLIALDYSPNFDYIVPQIACYRSDAETTARIVFRKVLEIAASGSAVHSPQPLMPDFIAGASVTKLA